MFYFGNNKFMQIVIEFWKRKLDLNIDIVFYGVISTLDIFVSLIMCTSDFCWKV